MPLVGPHEDGRRAYVPRARVGLLQNEGEMPRTPGFDLYPLLAGGEQWDLQLFTERTFGGLSAPSPMDALVVGYNAVHLSPAVRETFDAAPPAVHLLVLHQLAPECLSFLRDELTIRARPMPGSRATTGARLPEGRSLEHEMLLNWPAPVPVDDRADTTLRRARALRYLDVEPGGAWRVVLEAQANTRFGRRSLPVLVRTADFVPRRIVVCTLLLLSTRDAALLEN